MTDAIHNFHPQYSQYTQYSAGTYSWSTGHGYHKYCRPVGTYRGPPQVQLRRYVPIEYRSRSIPRGYAREYASSQYTAAALVWRQYIALRYPKGSRSTAASPPQHSVGMYYVYLSDAMVGCLPGTPLVHKYSVDPVRSRQNSSRGYLWYKSSTRSRVYCGTQWGTAG